jgi:hypothetical protein
LEERKGRRKWQTKAERDGRRAESQSKEARLKNTTKIISYNRMDVNMEHVQKTAD